VVPGATTGTPRVASQTKQNKTNSATAPAELKFSTIQNSQAAPVVSHNHEVCLGTKRTEGQASPSTAEFGVPLPKVQKSIKWKNPEHDFFDDCSNFLTQQNPF